MLPRPQLLDRISTGAPRPWVIELPVLLKRVKNPIPLLAKAVDYPAARAAHGERAGRYVTNCLVGFDCVRGDWGGPVGDGEVSDITLAWTLTVLRKDSGGLATYCDVRCEVRLTNGVDGIQRGEPDGVESPPRGRIEISGYEAPSDHYSNVPAITRSARGDHAEATDDRRFLHYFRIRTQANEEGAVTNALYGKINGQLNGDFRYYLNLKPNDRNVEFDPKRNLLTEVSRAAQPTEP